MNSRVLSCLVVLTVFSGISMGATQWGGEGFTAVPGDYNGDGFGDYAVYQEASGSWFVLSAQSNVLNWGFMWGGPGFTPASGDFDGDGASDMAVYLETSGDWYIYSPCRELILSWGVNWGWNAANPVPGDYDGDGKTDLAVYHEQSGDWYVQRSGDSGQATVGDVSAFRTALEQQGLTVADGSLTNLDVVGMFNAGLLPSCYGNNNDTPYFVVVVPPAEDQTIVNTLPWGFCLRPDEAIVLVGKTPPESVYFSYLGYLGIRYFPQSNLRSRVFASFGDAINNCTIWSEKTPGGSSGQAWDSRTMIIYTADRGTDTMIRNAATQAGYSSSMINTHVVPSTMVRLGVDTNADELIFLHRVTYFADTNAGAAYLSNPEPDAVFRVSTSGNSTLDPFPTPTTRIRGTGTNEFDLNDTLEDLRDAILAAHADYDSTQLVTSIWLTEGSDGIQRGVDLLGECRDTVYLCTEDFSLASNEFLVVYGVNHKETGKATYANVNVYGVTPINNTKEWAGVASVSTENYLPGTASRYLGDDPDADKFYAYRIAWSNPENLDDCLIIPQPYGRLKLEVLMIAFRTYIEPGKKVGPLYNELLYDKAILFRPRQ